MKKTNQKEMIAPNVHFWFDDKTKLWYWGFDEYEAAQGPYNTKEEAMLGRLEDIIMHVGKEIENELAVIEELILNK